MRRGIAELWRHNDFEHDLQELQLELYLAAVEELNAQLEEETAP